MSADNVGVALQALVLGTLLAAVALRLWALSSSMQVFRYQAF